MSLGAILVTFVVVPIALIFGGLAVLILVVRAVVVTMGIVCGDGQPDESEPHASRPPPPMTTVRPEDFL